MKFTKKIRARGCIQLPETLLAVTGGKEGTELDVYFGARYDVVVITTKDANLSNDDKRRINLLTTGHEHE